MAVPKKYRVLVPFRWVDPKTDVSQEFYTVGQIVPGSDMPDPEKHLAGVDDRGPLIVEETRSFGDPVVSTVGDSSAKEK